ncbi:uncharacterized protein [Henckelia pumila]|uniref:uncharacterized protein n=1 Tax=Henckelia pumila TaxID=405737 RepID=UPI003C6E38F1
MIPRRNGSLTQDVHITSPRRDWFIDFQELDSGYVLLGNNQSCKISGIGSIKLRMWDGSIKILTDVRYISDLKRNLIYLGTLDHKGPRYKAQNGTLKVVKGSLVIIKAILKQGLYVLQGVNLSPEINVTTTDKDQTLLWHQRLGHMSLKGLQELSKQGFLDHKHINNLEFCESCVLGKSHKLKFNTATHNTKYPLDYIHADLWGSPQGKLSPRAKKGIFLGYPTGVKGYRVWLLDDLKFIISRDVIFNEAVFYKANKHALKPASSKQAEQDTLNADQQLPKDITSDDKEVGADFNIPEQFYDISHAENEISHQTNDTSDANSDEHSDDQRQEQQLNEYMLARDRVRRDIKLPSRFASSDFTAFALNVAEIMDLKERSTYEEAMLSRDRALWTKSMQDEFKSLIKNNKWELVDKPKNKRVVGCKWILKGNQEFQVLKAKVQG